MVDATGYMQVLPIVTPARLTGEWRWPVGGQGCGCVRCKEPVPDPDFPGVEESARLRAAAAEKRRAWVAVNSVTERTSKGSHDTRYV